MFIYANTSVEYSDTRWNKTLQNKLKVIETVSIHKAFGLK